MTRFSNNNTTIDGLKKSVVSANVFRYFDEDVVVNADAVVAFNTI